MSPRPPGSTRLDTRFPYTTLSLSQPACLPRCRRHLLQQHQVAVVGGGAVEHHAPEDRSPHLRVAGCQAGNVEPLPAARLRHLQRPEARLPRLGAQSLQPVRGDVLMLVVGRGVGFQRDDLCLDEVTQPLSQALDLGRQGEVHVRSSERGQSYRAADWPRSEEHTSELQSLMRISYAVFCLKKKNNTH